MEWIFDNLPIAFILFVVYSIVNAVKRAREKQTEHEASGGETAEQRRVREIQERMRRIAAERRGARVPADQSAPRHVESRPPPPPPPPPLDPFGGPLKRMLDELEKRSQPAIPPPVPVRVDRAEVERQEQLADQLRALEETKTIAQRRAAHLADAAKAQANPAAAERAAVRGRMLDDLHDPESLRRAFLLREVLGAPVALR